MNGGNVHVAARRLMPPLDPLRTQAGQHFLHVRAVQRPERHPALCELAVHLGEQRQMRRLRHMKPPARRSEEHTSELQSLMRISYAVFCLKKNKSITTNTEQKYNEPIV